MSTDVKCRLRGLNTLFVNNLKPLLDYYSGQMESSIYSWSKLVLGVCLFVLLLSFPCFLGYILVRHLRGLEQW